MDTKETTREIKRVDPIWRRLRVTRLYSIGLLIYMIAYVIFTIWVSSTEKSAMSSWIFFLIFFPLVAVMALVNQFAQERYWLRVGQRRLEALRDPQPFLTHGRFWADVTDATSITLPMTLRLKINRGVLMGAGVVLLLLVLATLASGIWMAFDGKASLIAFLISLVVLFIAILIAVFAYTLYMRYAPQCIELTEEGMRTRYLRQERAIRWNEARLFAVYDALGVRKTPAVQTYELSNEQTVVRWAQRSPVSALLTTEVRGLEDSDDFNWLVQRVNALVAARTGLPLVNLSDQPAKAGIDASAKGARGWNIPAAREQRSIAAREERSEPSPATTAVGPSAGSFAPEDSLERRIQFKGETALSFGILGAMGLLLLAIGLVEKLTGNGAGEFDNLATFALVAGILMLLLFGFVVSVLTVVRAYLRRIASRRVLALREPEHLRAGQQPVPYTDVPRPASLRIRLKWSRAFAIAFIESLVIGLLLFGVLFSWTRHWQVDVVVALVYALLMGLLLAPLLHRVGEQRIDVSASGLTTRLGGVESHINWDEARLFATYRPWQPLRTFSRTQMYELTSDHLVTRWRWPHGHFSTLSTQPHMSRDEMENWAEDLQGLIVARTGLALMDLNRG